MGEDREYAWEEEEAEAEADASSTWIIINQIDLYVSSIMVFI